LEDNLKIVLDIQALIAKAADELNVSSDQLLTNMVIDCLGNREDAPGPLPTTVHVTGAVPARAEQIML
jgi:hypothetical protein